MMNEMEQYLGGYSNYLPPVWSYLKSGLAEKTINYKHAINIAEKQFHELTGGRYSLNNGWRNQIGGWITGIFGRR